VRFDGKSFRRSTHFTFRNPRPGECYVDGKPIDPRYCVFVRIADCEMKNGCYVRESASKILPLTGHGLTNMAFGPWYKRKTPFGPVQERWECRIYLAYDGRVYTHTHRSDKRPTKAPGGI